MHIKMMPYIFDVKPIIEELAKNAEVWNEIAYRTAFRGSPHREVDDIWMRYNPIQNYNPEDPLQFHAEHTAEWYPVAARLPYTALLAYDLQDITEAERMGAVLITRIPPGRQVYAHVDQGWHARYFEKFVIQIKGNSKQAFCFEGESLSAEAGQCYWFDNAYSHWVTNESEEERISLIVCLRRKSCHYM